MRKRWILWLMLLLVFLMMVAGIRRLVLVGENGTRTLVKKMSITASFYPIYFFVSQVAGDGAEILSVTPFGVEPHDYELSPKDVVMVQKSKVLFTLGGGFEPWLDRVKQDLGEEEVVELSKGLLEESEDVHIWLSPRLARKMVEKIKETLVEVDPDNKEYYQANYMVLDKRLVELQELFARGLAACERREAVVSHAAFGYLFKDFGLEQVAISGLSPEEEPSAKQMVEIAKRTKERDIDYIFFERLVSPELAETVAREVGAKTLVLDPLEGIENENKNYFTVMEENLANLRLALKCQ